MGKTNEATQLQNEIIDTIEKYYSPPENKNNVKK